MHFNPVRIVWEPLNSLSNYASGKHILLVTTPGFIERGVVDCVKKTLSNQNVIVWDGIKPNPDLCDLDEATGLIKILKPDCIIGLGGGSVLDAAKVLATTLANFEGPTLTEIFRHGKVSTWNKRLPLIAIPTTAGTGSEVTPFATIWDHLERKKHSLTGDFIFPDIALLDPALTLTLGPDDTLYPALDAISHALESLWNKNCTSISRMFAFNALSLSNEALPLVQIEPKIIELRKKLLLASVSAGVAISQTRTAIAHAKSYDLTLRYGVPHGLACSFNLCHWIEAVLESCPEVFDGGEVKILQIHSFLSKMNLKSRLKDYIGSNYESIIDELNVDTSRLANFVLEKNK